MSASTSHSHSSSRAKEPEIVESSQRPLAVVRAIFITIALVLFFFATAGSVRSWWKERQEAKAEEKAEQRAREETAKAATPATKVLIPRFDGFTPIEFPINWPFEIETEGCPIIVHFPGVPEPVHYSGRGSMPTPERTSGITEIASGLNKQVRVRIREVKYIH